VSSLLADVAQYFDHFEDKEWLEQLFARHAVDDVLDAVAALARSGDPSLVVPALKFARDVGLHFILDPAHTDAIRERMPERLFPALADTLCASSWQVRASAVYTIGKLSFESQAGLLLAAYERARDADPLLLYRILTELNWLQPDTHWPLAAQLADHEHYLVRWSLLGVLSSVAFQVGIGDPLDELCAKLEQDPCPQIAAEAAFRRQEAQTQPRARAALSAPALIFDNIEVHFLRELPEAADYSLDELDAFVRRIAADC
jgi:hypothetical protein